MFIIAVLISSLIGSLFVFVTSIYLGDTNLFALNTALVVIGLIFAQMTIQRKDRLIKRLLDLNEFRHTSLTEINSEQRTELKSAFIITHIAPKTVAELHETTLGRRYLELFNNLATQYNRDLGRLRSNITQAGANNIPLDHEEKN